MELQRDSKLALVSGSTAGIGYAIAGMRAREGARVVVNGRTASTVDEAAAGTGITVNSALPGPTTSRSVGDFVEDMARANAKSFDQVEAEFFDPVRPTSLIKRLATPQEVAWLVAYVASPPASATTGAARRVDGGVVKSAF